jgi:hypothetical protein
MHILYIDDPLCNLIVFVLVALKASQRQSGNMAHRKTGNVYYDDGDFDDGFSDDEYWDEEDDYDEYDDTVSKPQTVRDSTLQRSSSAWSN